MTVVNSIINIPTFYYEIFKEERTRWETISKKIEQCIEFKEFKSGLVEKSHKIIIYSHTQYLRITTFFFLILDQLIKPHQLERETDGVPDFYYTFATQLPDLNLGFVNEVDSTYFDQFFHELMRSMSHKEHIPATLDHPFWSALKDCFSSYQLVHEPFQAVAHFDQVKTSVPVKVGHLFSLVKDIFEHSVMIAPVIEKKHVQIFPTLLFKGKELMRSYQVAFIQGKGLLHLIKTFQVKFHQLIYKTHTTNAQANQADANAQANAMINEVCELANRLRKDYKDNIGIFIDYDVNKIELLKKAHTDLTNMGYSLNTKLSDCGIVSEPEREEFQLIAPCVESAFTLADLETFIHYLLEVNNLKKVAWFLLINPLINLSEAVNELFKKKLSDQVYKEMILAERIPLIHFTPSVDRQLYHMQMGETASPYLRQRKTPKKSTPHFTKPIAFKENALTEASPLNQSAQVTETLFESVRKRMPPLLKTLELPASFKQCVIYLDDLETLTTFSPSALKCIMVWNSTYRFLEQLMRYEIFTDQSKDLQEHHLTHLGAKIDPAKLAPLQKVLHELSGAHLWTEQTYESHHILKYSHEKTPTVLSQIYQLFNQLEVFDYNFENLLEDTLQGTKQFLGSQNYNCLQQSIPLSFPPLPFKKIEITPIQDLLKKTNPESRIARLLLETDKDVRLLHLLEGTLQKGISSAQLPTLVRMAAKLHHAILQHLLQAIYLTNHIQDKREHNLIFLIEAIVWKNEFPKHLTSQIDSTYADIHRLSNYPFDANTIQSDWHKAILDAELIRAEPGLLQGFKHLNPIIQLGSIEINLDLVSLEAISNQIILSRRLLDEILPSLFKELSEQVLKEIIYK